MNPYPEFLVCGSAAAALIFGSVASRLDEKMARGGAVAVAAIAGGTALIAAGSTAALALVALVIVQAVAVLVAAPRTRSRKPLVFNTMLILGGHLLAVGSTLPALRLVGWAVTLVPLIVARNEMPRGYLAAQSMAFLAVAVAEVSPLGGTAAAVLLLVGGLLRSGLPPFHVPQLRFFEVGEASLVALFTASPVGVLAFSAGMARTEVVVHGWLGSLASSCFMASLLYLALLALAQNAPRALAARLSLFAIGAASVFAASGDAVARGAGALLTLVAGLATIGLLLVVWLVEERFGRDDLAARSGFARRVPTLGALFLLFSLLGAGAPLTVGFVAEDLWLRSLSNLAAASGAFVVVASAICAIAAYRVYARTFLGAGEDLPASVDATGRERAALALIVVASLLAGLAPGASLGVLRDDFQSAHRSHKETKRW